jgi:hypothetical protein
LPTASRVASGKRLSANSLPSISVASFDFPFPLIVVKLPSCVDSPVAVNPAITFAVFMSNTCAVIPT